MYKAVSREQRVEEVEEAEEAKDTTLSLLLYIGETKRTLKTRWMGVLDILPDESGRILKR
jgi:hypothetical protein